MESKTVQKALNYEGQKLLTGRRGKDQHEEKRDQTVDFRCVSEVWAWSLVQDSGMGKPRQ